MIDNENSDDTNNHMSILHDYIITWTNPFNSEIIFTALNTTVTTHTVTIMELFF